MDVAKADLRREMLRLIGAFPETGREAASIALCESLHGRLSDEGAILVFLPDDREPAIDPAIRRWIDEGRVVVAPRMDWNARLMVPVRLSSLDDIETRRHGVREPALPADGSGEIALDTIVAALVPGVAFDRSGRRLGRGGGFYDRFLARLPREATRIGVCFEQQIVERLPSASHDEAVDELATEGGVRLVRATTDDKCGQQPDVADV